MERLKIGECSSSIIIDCTPNGLRDLANILEARAKTSVIGSSIFIPITNSVSVLYNISMKEVTWVKVVDRTEQPDSSQTLN